MDALSTASYFGLAGFAFLVFLLVVSLLVLCIGLFFPCFCNMLGIGFHLGVEDEEEDDAVVNDEPQLPVTIANPRGRVHLCPQGLRPEQLRLLPVFAYQTAARTTGESEEDCCSVCLEQFQEKDQVGRLPPCNHYFHASCICRWLGLSPRCPICRSPVNLKPELVELQQVLVMVLPASTPPSTVQSSPP